MTSPNTTSQKLIRTIAGALTGALVALICWMVLFMCAIVDDAAHWKGTLLAFGMLLPILCITGGVIVSRSITGPSDS